MSSVTATLGFIYTVYYCKEGNQHLTHCANYYMGVKCFKLQKYVKVVF